MQNHLLQVRAFVCVAARPPTAAASLPIRPQMRMLREAAGPRTRPLRTTPPPSQMVALVAMEQPLNLTAEHIRQEKLKVLNACRPVALDDLVVGQYDGYRADPEIRDQRTRTETFAAAVLHVHNPRWDGVPFVLKVRPPHRRNPPPHPLVPALADTALPVSDGHCAQLLPAPTGQQLLACRPSERTRFVRVGVRACVHVRVRARVCACARAHAARSFSRRGRRSTTRRWSCASNSTGCLESCPTSTSA